MHLCNGVIDCCNGSDEEDLKDNPSYLAASLAAKSLQKSFINNFFWSWLYVCRWSWKAHLIFLLLWRLSLNLNLNRGQLHLLGKLTSLALRIIYNTCRHRGTRHYLPINSVIFYVSKWDWKCIPQWMDTSVVAGAHYLKMKVKVKMSQGMGGDCSSLYEGWELEKASSGPWGAGQKRSIWDGK